jgi:VWFA-related protein
MFHTTDPNHLRLPLAAIINRQTKAPSTSIRQPHAPDLDPLEAETAHRPEPYTPFCHLEAKRAVRRLHGLALSGFGFVVILAAALGQCSVVITAKPAATGTGDPELRHRREIPSEAVSAEGLIRLDATVTDQAGKAIAGLQRADFELLDNGQPQKIIAFRASKAPSASADDSLTIIILLDTLNLPPDLAAFERQHAAQFLRQNSGKLALPVIIYSLEDSGFFLAAKPSRDGEALATAVASDNKVDAYFLAPHVHSPFKAIADTSLDSAAVLAGLRALGTIATREVTEPGRKLLFWIGPGLSNRGTGAIAPDGHALLRSSNPNELGYSISGKKGEEVKRDLFQKILWFSALLRQARVTVDCFSIGEDNPVTDAWNQFLAAIPSAQQANWMNLFKDVLAVQSGGRAFLSSKSPVEPMNECVENAQTFYTFTFDPPLAAHADEHHSLKVELSQPTLTARTSTGYYDQPFYNDPPDPGIQRLTVAQLEQALQAGPRQLSAVVVTDRLSHVKLQSFLEKLHGKKLRESLEMIADESTFLDPPSAELSADPPPDQAEQQRMLSTAADYLSRVIPKLPDFFATRTAIPYREVAPYPGLNTTNMSELLHAEQQSKETVLYRKGEEVVSSASPHTGTELQTYGTFGPILNVLLQFVSKSPGDVTWGWWEKSANGRRAVFRYRIAGNPTLDLVGCCYPNGSPGARVKISAGSHGEFVIDPETGAILRVQTESDLPGLVPTKQSDMMVSYGPVEIGGKTYVVPLRSVSIWRSRSVARLLQWNIDFATWGPYETQMNVFTFDQYHMFRGNARILPGFEQVPDKVPTAPQ